MATIVVRKAAADMTAVYLQLRIAAWVHPKRMGGPATSCRRHSNKNLLYLQNHSRGVEIEDSSTRMAAKQDLGKLYTFPASVDTKCVEAICLFRVPFLLVLK